MYTKAPERNTTKQDWKDALLSEMRVLSGYWPMFYGAEIDWDALYEGREKNWRCCCCGAYIVPAVTGTYEGRGGACIECGTAQEGDEGEYEKVSGARYDKLRRYYRSAGKSYLHTLR